eukprot:GFUD01043737.1.p1 GENE.GFUD01043737.1~~GFUD01043737.1.p1  ORF type:complete len:1387 (-),score=455.56 GFUD01043737.1:260-4420(-)
MDQDSLSLLKRKIISVNKLLKDKNKTEAKNVELNVSIEQKNKTISDKETEIGKLKSELLDSLVTSPIKNGGQLSKLEKELEETRKMLEDKTAKVAKFREESVSRSQKIGHLEIDLGKRNNRMGVLEKELVKKNNDIIKRELDSQELKKQFEELQASKLSLENDLKSGKHVESMKQTYDDIKWKNLAEISSLKQEKAAFEKKVKELFENNEILTKKCKELDKSSESDSKRLKLNDTFDKQLEKKDKAISSLEKKLDKALKDNEKLKLRLSKKGIQSGEDTKEEIIDKGSESEMDISDAPLTEDESEMIPPPRKTFCFFSLSKPNARFSICKPKISQRKLKVQFTKFSSVIENLPVVYNLTPSISDSLPFLKPSEPPTKPFKRKLEDENLKTPHPNKKLKVSNILHHHDVPDSTSPPQMSSLQPSSNSYYSAPTSSSKEAFSLPMVPTPLNHSTPTPVSIPTSSHFFPLPLPPTPLNYSNPNPAKSRHSHSTKSGISPLQIPPNSTPKQQTTAKFDLVKGTKNKLKIAPPPQLSPIKSPKVLPCNQELPTTTSVATPNTARARILASSFAPQAVEAQVKVVGGKLNQTQLDAAKRRAISVTHFTSVNGFRQSANEMKAASRGTNASNIKGATDKMKVGRVDKKPQNTSEELVYCPSRRRTNPVKVSAISNSELNQQSGAPALSEKSIESAIVVEDIKETTSGSENSKISIQSREHVTESASSPKSLPVAESKIKSKEFLSTEESSDDEHDADRVQVNGISKKSVVSFDEVSLNNSSHEVSSPVKQNSSELKKVPKRSESLDEDLDISDSDDDNREDLGPLIASLGGDEECDQTSLTSNEAISNKGDQGNSSTSILEKPSKSDSARIVEEAPENRKKSMLASGDQLRSESDDENNRSSGRFDRLKSETRLVQESHLQTVKVEKDCEEKPPARSLPVIGKQRTFVSRLEELIFNYKSRSDENEKKRYQEREKLSKERSSFAYDAYVECIQKHFKNLMGSQNEESFGKLVDGIASNSNPQNEAIVCDLVYEYLKAEHRDSPLLNASDENQPAITRKQQRLFVVLTTLSEKPRYKNILERMLNLLWHNLFGRDRMFNLKLNAVQNSGRMFVLCARYTDNVSLMKHFLYDLFYFKSPRNHILVGIVIALWPTIFCYASSPLSTTPLSQTVTWCIFNTGPAQNSPEMLVQETKDNFSREYGYKANAVKADSLVIKFIKMAEERSQDKELLEEIAMCLLLIGRSKEFRWVNNNISARLLKSLASVWGGSDSGEQTVLRWVITTLGLLSRVYPAEGREQVKTLYQSVESLLQKGASLQPETELCCINALLHLGYHLQHQVAMFLKTWQPSHPVDSKTRQMLEDFVGTRGKKHADITAKVARIEHNKLRKRRGLKNS